MSEFKVRLGDMFYIPYPEDNAIVFATERGYASLNKHIDTVLKNRGIIAFNGIRYLGNILDMYNAAMGDMHVPDFPGMGGKMLSEWKWKGY